MSAPFLPFDLEHLRESPELHALGGALAAFVERANRDGSLGQRDAESAVRALLRALPASDACEACGTFDEAYIPYALHLDREGAICEYRCQEGHCWECWWGPRALVVQVP